MLFEIAIHHNPLIQNQAQASKTCASILLVHIVVRTKDTEVTAFRILHVADNCDI